jgi:hypothetical protein
MQVRGVGWAPHRTADCLVLEPKGVLDAVSYRRFRDDLVKFAMDRPRAVIVVVDELVIGSGHSLTAFSSAGLRVGEWPGVPILLVARDAARRASIGRSTMARFVPVHASVDVAIAAVSDPPPGRRAEVDLVGVTASSRLARAFVHSTCRRWNVAGHVTEAMEVATELVENAILHADSGLSLRLELRDGRLTVAVRDGCPREAVLRERTSAPAGGLHLVAHLARAWGCVPDARGGKVVWAVLDT